MTRRGRNQRKQAEKKQQVTPKDPPQYRLPEDLDGAHIDKVVIHQQRSRFHSGPLPSPEVLKEYNNVVPGAAETIINMAVKQQDHRMGLEDKVISSDIHRSWTAMIIGAIIALSAIGGGVYLIDGGHSAEGISSIIGSLATLGGATAYGIWSRRDKVSEKGKQSKEMAKAED